MGVGQPLRHPLGSFRKLELPTGTRRKTSKGQATSEEESRFPRFFDTLEYREGNPERGFFLKCLRGGRTSRGVPKPGKPGGGSRQRRSRRTHPRTERRATAATVEAEAMEGERPREEESQESQDGVPAEKSNGAAPTGSGMKPLKRGRDGLRAVVRRRRSGDPGSGTATRKGCRERSAGPCRASADASNRRGIRGGTSAARDFRVATACRMPIAGGDVASRGVDDRCQVKL